MLQAIRRRKRTTQAQCHYFEARLRMFPDQPDGEQSRVLRRTKGTLTGELCVLDGAWDGLPGEARRQERGSGVRVVEYEASSESDVKGGGSPEKQTATSNLKRRGLSKQSAGVRDSLWRAQAQSLASRSEGPRLCNVRRQQRGHHPHTASGRLSPLRA